MEIVFREPTSHSVKSSTWLTNLTTLRAVAITVITLKFQISEIRFYSDQFEQSNAKDGGLEGETTDSGETRLLVTHLSVKSHHRHV